VNNGKHFVAALIELEKEYTAILAACPPDGSGMPDWAVAGLREVYADGLIVDFVCYPSDDRLLHAAAQCLAHEQEQNRYRPSTISDRIAVVRRAREQSGGDWSAAKQGLITVLGAQKTSTVQRWMVLARDLDGEIAVWIDTNIPNLSQSFIVGNKYVIGKGEEARFKLSNPYSIIALKTLQDQLEIKAISSTTFVNEFCAPFKQLEVWEKSQIKTFGVTASSFAAFQRVVRRCCLSFSRPHLISSTSWGVGSLVRSREPLVRTVVRLWPNDYQCDPLFRLTAFRYASGCTLRCGITYLV
jgi:hypothetical protein